MAWKCGCQPFGCPCSKNEINCRKEICSTCLFQASIPAIPFGNFNHPLPTRSLRLLRAAIRSSSSALCLHYACKRSHPFVEDSGFVSYAEKHRFGHGVVVSKVCYRILEFVFSHLPCRLLQCVEVDSGLEVGLPAFQLPIFAKCNALLKGDLLDTFVFGMHAF